MLQGCVASGPTVAVVNQFSSQIDVTNPKKVTINIGKNWGRRLKKGEAVTLTSSSWREPVNPKIRPGRYTVIVVDKNGAVSSYDTNDLQVELSAAAHVCSASHSSNTQGWMNCIAKTTYKGIPRSYAQEAFGALWEDYDYWRICEPKVPSPSLREFASAAGLQVHVLRESPFVATVPGFLNSSDCDALMGSMGKDDLTRAHVGSGGGGTSTSDARETLTSNMFVDWSKVDILSATSVKTFDLVSELLDERVPYEGQEPINFLHYLKGFEYKPHTDGAGENIGKRVATTLIYCEAARKGGATVFPVGEHHELKFAPGPGDLLFFKYQPDPGLAMHAACPVIEGSKSTLTQWHRLGVSVQKPWDNFESWGRFHNPYGASRWKGLRYGGKDEL